MGRCVGKAAPHLFTRHAQQLSAETPSLVVWMHGEHLEVYRVASRPFAG